MSDSIVSIKNLNYSYRHNLALEQINLEIHQGDYLAVIGPNGGGKTTLIKLIMGLLKPDQGEISVFGENPERIQGKIGYVPQQIGYSDGFPVTVMQAVLMGLAEKKRFGWRFSNQEKERALEMLKYVDMEGFHQHKISELSGGQKQRVFLARAMISEPQLLVLDEPTSAIDPQGSFCFYSFLEELNKKVTIIVVSHNLNFIASKIYSVACVNKRLLYSNSPNLTPDMMELLYGAHSEHHCNVGMYLKEEMEHMAQLHDGEQ